MDMAADSITGRIRVHRKYGAYFIPAPGRERDALYHSLVTDGGAAFFARQPLAKSPSELPDGDRDPRHRDCGSPEDILGFRPAAVEADAQHTVSFVEGDGIGIEIARLKRKIVHGIDALLGAFRFLETALSGFRRRLVDHDTPPTKRVRR